jgi:alpha-D-ribose 1-methylphosphonate 5-triphosphate synthase subunit PhnH
MDSFEAVGHVRVTKTDKVTGEVVFDQVFKNQITNFARGQVAKMWTGIMVPTPNQIAVGTGAGTISANDTAMWAEISGSRLICDYAATWLTYYVQYSVTYDQATAIAAVTAQNPTGSINLTEAGLFDSSGALWSHVQLNGVTHDNTTTLTIQWQVLQKGN